LAKRDQKKSGSGLVPGTAFSRHNVLQIAGLQFVWSFLVIDE
jgi:hypothetical protein